MPLRNFIIWDPDDFDSGDGVDAEGAYLFDDIKGFMQPRSVQLEVFRRPGYDGESTRDTGASGKAFGVVSVHYVADRGAAFNALNAYVTLKDGNPYEIYQHGVSWGFFKVLDVDHVGLIPCATVAGSILQEQASPQNPTVCQYVQWTLVSTPAPPEP